MTEKFVFFRLLNIFYSDYRDERGLFWKEIPYNLFGSKNYLNSQNDCAVKTVVNYLNFIVYGKVSFVLFG